MTRQFQITPARRTRVPLLIGLAGMAGSGKTFSAMRLGTGIARVFGGRLHVIDTEAKRALHYADRFDFDHVPFEPPFGPSDYLDALRQCVSAGAGCVIVDSASHMHAGQGGMLDQHDALLDKWCGNDWNARERNNMRAWIQPKRELDRFVQGLLQLSANVIFCFRAKDKIRPAPTGASEKKPVELGTMAIADDSLIYEMTAQALLEPGSGGVPNWKPPLKGEALQTKLPAQFAKLLQEQGPLSEEMGEMMGRWAAGVDQRSTEPSRQLAESGPKPPIAMVLKAIGAAESTEALATIAERDRAYHWTEQELAEIRAAIRKRKSEL